MADKVDFTEIHYAGGYGSEFESDSEAKRKRDKRDKDLVSKKKKTTDGVANKRELEAEYSKEEGKTQRFHILSMDAFTRHKKFINDYLLYYGGSKADFRRDTSRDRTDMDVIREHHKFLWEEGEEDDSWEKNLAKKYYDKLFKEYCITDLSRYKENKVAMRWRTESEVVDGKGQFICGSRKCQEKRGLRSWEVNFGYVEHGIKKNALVKLRLCPDCSYKLNYHHRKKEVLPKSKKKHLQSEPVTKKHRPDSELHTEVKVSESTEQDSIQDGQTASTESEIWGGPAKVTEEKSREEEFEDYFEDMFL